MIEPNQVPNLLVAACPSFERSYTAHVAEHGDDLLYVAAGELARTLLNLDRQGSEAELSAVGDMIERLHIEGTPWVKEFATIGILEAIQNVWSNEGAEPSRFVRFLGPESRRWWLGLNAFWEGRASSVRSDA